MDIQSLAKEINYQNLEELNLTDIEKNIINLQNQSKSSGIKLQEYKTKYWTYFLNPNDIRLNSIYGKFMIFFSWNLNTAVKEIGRASCRERVS